MGEITREMLHTRRAECAKARDQFDGAIMLIDEMLALLEPEPLTLDQLKEQVGAVEIGQPVPTEAAPPRPD